MAENAQFNPLAMVGTLPASDTSEIRFYVDEYKGYPFASIRTFVRRENYSGPTKAGITMNPGLLEQVISTLEKLPKEPEATQDTELARLAKKPGVELVVRITIYRDATGVDLREWVDDDNYQGWSKKGVRIAYADISKAAGFLKEMLVLLKDKVKSSSPPKKNARSSSAEAPSKKTG
ncbi:MAG: PC4/YdbC family ssDNA-binding protein [Elusimicrobiota bacterium]